MPIYYNLSYENHPFSLESIGNYWVQEPVQRQNGYPYFHWLQTEAGIGEVWIADTLVSLRAGQGILIAPFVPHRYAPQHYPKWVTNFATFDGSINEQLSKVVKTNSYLLAEDDVNFSFSNWVNQQTALLSSNTYVDQLQLSLACYEFLLQLRQFSNEHASQQHPLFQEYVEPTIKEIETNFASELTVELLAQKSYISPQYLTRLFQRFLHVSTYRYILQFRINKAKELLVNEIDLDVQQISHFTGFKDASHFVASFKKETGFTPLEFRRLHRSVMSRKE